MKTKRTIKKALYIQTLYGLHRCIFEPDKKGFIVTTSDLEGVVTWGRNLNHAKAMAKEAIELCIECLAMDAVGERQYAHHGNYARSAA